MAYAYDALRLASLLWRRACALVSIKKTYFSVGVDSQHVPTSRKGTLCQLQMSYDKGENVTMIMNCVWVIFMRYRTWPTLK